MLHYTERIITHSSHKATTSTILGLQRASSSHPQWKWHFVLQHVKSTWYGSISVKWPSVLRVKACVGGPHHQPSWGCSQLCHPLWGNRTVPTILWQQSPAGDISDSFGSAHSCRNRKQCVTMTVKCWFMSYRAKTFFLTKRIMKINSWSISLPFINALLTEAVCAGQNEVCLSIHADTALLLISQLLHSAWPHKQKADKVWTIFFLPKILFWNKMSDESWCLAIKGFAWEKYPSVV